LHELAAGFQARMRNGCGLREMARDCAMGEEIRYRKTEGANIAASQHGQYWKVTGIVQINIAIDRQRGYNPNLNMFLCGVSLRKRQKKTCALNVTKTPDAFGSAMPC
jgi:hypothetical protein